MEFNLGLLASDSNLDFETLTKLSNYNLSSIAYPVIS